MSEQDEAGFSPPIARKRSGTEGKSELELQRELDRLSVREGRSPASVRRRASDGVPLFPVRQIGSQERRSVAYHFSQMVAPEDIVACVLNPRYLLIDLREEEEYDQQRMRLSVNLPIRTILEEELHESSALDKLRRWREAEATIQSELPCCHDERCVKCSQAGQESGAASSTAGSSDSAMVEGCHCSGAGSPSTSPPTNTIIGGSSALSRSTVAVRTTAPASDDTVKLPRQDTLLYNQLLLCQYFDAHPHLRILLEYAVEFQLTVVVLDEKGDGISGAVPLFLSLAQHAQPLDDLSTTLALLFSGMQYVRGGIHRVRKRLGKRKCGVLFGSTSDLCIAPSDCPKSDLTADDTVSCITEHLYVGRQLAGGAGEEAYLEKNGITHVLNVNSKPDTVLPCCIKNYREVTLRDTFDQVLDFEQLMDLTHYIRTSMEESVENRVYVHCSWGISRAPTIAMAFLVRYCGETAKSAYLLTHRRRPCIGPNVNFMYRLLLFESDIASTMEGMDGWERKIPSLPLQYYVLSQTRKENLYSIFQFVEQASATLL